MSEKPSQPPSPSDPPTVLHTTAGDVALHEYRATFGGHAYRILHTGAVLTFLDEQILLSERETRLPYGIALWPCLLNTQGGPRRNVRGEILDTRGKPIRRLYGAGELGSIWGFLYQSGGNLGECLGLGRMVGLNVAAEPSLT